MCDPTMVMLGISAITAGAGVAQKKQQQKDQVEQVENQADSLVQDYNFQQKNLENEARSEQDVVENQLFNANIDAAKTRSSVLAQNSGTTGQTVDAIDQDLGSQIGRNENDINKNYDIFQQSSQSASDSNYRSLASALTGMSGGIQGPGFLDSALKIGGAAYGGYNAGKAYNAKISDGYVKK